MDEIEIVRYDPRWPAMFAEEALLLRRALNTDLVIDVEHFGSTAIPGMAAKPIIDILIRGAIAYGSASHRHRAAAAA